MSISVRNIKVTIDGICSSGFCIIINDVMWRLDNFTLCQHLLNANELYFRMHKGPEEDIDDTLFKICGDIIGKEITVSLETNNIESILHNYHDDNNNNSIDFKGVIVSAEGSRENTEYFINVNACSYDELLNDNLNCKSFENKTLNEIIRDVVDEYEDVLDCNINSRFDNIIPYCVQYNETNYEFIQRLAKHYGEWLYNNGTSLVFGVLKEENTIKLNYPSKDIPNYNVNLKIRPVTFNHVASSYTSYEANQKEGLEEMQREYNNLSEKVFEASQQCFRKSTLQNLCSGGFADQDGRESTLNVTTKTEARGIKAGMLKYTGNTYCSKLKIGGKLIIVDNFIDKSSYKKRDVDQDEILIIDLVHYFSSDETYSNYFIGIPSACDYPPYSYSDVFPKADPCRAKVVNNEDPKNLGRIKVQFDWQAQLDENMTTPWLRIAQPYAGLGKGFSFIPEIGEEVMVEFEGGNAERPYINGTLYNGVEDPDNLWLPNSNNLNQIKAIRTRNGHTIEIHDQGDNGYIRIYDNNKENYILTLSTDEKLIKLESKGNIELDAKNDIIIHAGHDITATSDNDTFIIANHDMQRSAENDIREHAGNDRTTTIDNNERISVEENQFIKIGENKDEQIVHKLQVTAENIREEAQDKLLQYSTTQNIQASDSISVNSSNRIDIKSGLVKVN